MASRTQLPHAFSRERNPKRITPLSETVSKTAMTVRPYASDWEEIKDEKNRSDILRDALRYYLRQGRPEV